MQAARLVREIGHIKTHPPWGICCDYKDSNSKNRLEAKILGPKGTPYENGLFVLQIDIPDKYPFEPPQVKFVTPVYHPNIDKGGRICLDLVKMPPKGDWRPTVSLESLLIAIQMLLANPNPDDPLMIDIANQYRHSRDEFNCTAGEYTKKYAS